MTDFIASVVALIVVLGLIAGVVFGWFMLLFQVMGWLEPFGAAIMLSGVAAYLAVSLVGLAVTMTD